MKKTCLLLVSLFIAAMYSFAQGDSNFLKTKSGLLYKIISDGKGEQLKIGRLIKFNAVVKQEDSVTYSSYGRIPAFTGVDSAARPYDLSEILPMMRNGDSAVMIQLADTIAKINGGEMPPGLNSGDKIFISIRIIQVLQNIEEAQADFMNELDLQKQREAVVVEDFLKTNQIAATKTEMGTYVAISKPGTGAKPDSGKLVSVKYTGMNFKGEKFDSNIDSSFMHTEPYQFAIGQQSTIPGFEDGIKQIAKGGKVKIYIPSMLGYGAQGSPPAIQPYEHLIFEIELVNITEPVKPKPKPKPVVKKKAPVKKKVTTKKPAVKPKPKPKTTGKK